MPWMATGVRGEEEEVCKWLSRGVNEVVSPLNHWAEMQPLLLEVEGD